MCGICGAIDWGEVRAAESAVQLMIPTMRHRGPDDEGHLFNAPVALGVRRLSIIDIEGGHQPVFNESGSLAIVFNGEIYNFNELRVTLENIGHTFRTRSDSEVVVHAYEQWGTACVERLRGMFAFAIYDRRKVMDRNRGVLEPNPAEDSCGQLFLARDRCGIKPLYFYQDENVFLFASEVRTLLASGHVPRSISPSALQSYLLFGSVSEPETLVKDVQSLPPGHRLLISLKTKPSSLQPEPYWSLAQPEGGNGHVNGFAKDQRGAVSRVRELLQESVRLHMNADVPVGIFLSSGIDSTALAALASREFSGVHTFTMAFPESRFSEAGMAERTAQQFGTTHQEFMLTPDDLLSRIDSAVAALDQPSVDGINTYFISLAASQSGLKVALSGLGGDELFGGYNTFRWVPRFERLMALGEKFPAKLRAAMARGSIKFGERIGSNDSAHKLAAIWNEPGALPHPYFFSRMIFTPAQVRKLFHHEPEQARNQAWWVWLNEGAGATIAMDSFSAITSLEARSYLVNTLLRDADSMSMASSLEVRVPFLDHSLIEFVSSLPAAMKTRQGTPKALLVESLKDLLPEEVINQPKRWFTFPWPQWLQGQLRDKMESGFAELSPALQPLLDAPTMRAIWQNFLAGRTSWARPWSLYVLNEWTKRYL